jgi:hypothetical protein
MVAVPLFVVVFRAVSHALAFQADRVRRALMSFASCRRFQSPPTARGGFACSFGCCLAYFQPDFLTTMAALTEECQSSFPGKGAR